MKNEVKLTLSNSLDWQIKLIKTNNKLYRNHFLVKHNDINMKFWWVEDGSHSTKWNNLTDIVKFCDENNLIICNKDEIDKLFAKFKQTCK